LHDQDARHSMTGNLRVTGSQFTVWFGDGKDTWVITSSIYVVVDSVAGNGQNEKHSRLIIRGINREERIHWPIRDGDLKVCRVVITPT